jgi:hypothetical protein
MKLICVKCLISEGHQIHKIEDINSAYRFLSKKFKKQFQEFNECSEKLTREMVKIEKEVKEQKKTNERYKVTLKQVYQELKEALKKKRNKMSRAGERTLKENTVKAEGYSKEILGFQEEMGKWSKMDLFLENSEQCDEEDMFFFLDKYTTKTEELEEDQAKARELVHANQSLLRKVKLNDCKTTLKLNMLSMMKKEIISNVSKNQESNKSRGKTEYLENESMMSKLTSKKFHNLIRKSQIKSKKSMNTSKMGDAQSKPFKYVSKTLMLDNMSIQKNLKNLQKDLSGEQFRQNFVKINPKSGKPSSGFNKIKNPAAKLKHTSNRKNAKIPSKLSKMMLNNKVTKFQFQSKNPDKLTSSKLKQRRAHTNWNKQNISSSRSQQHLLLSPINHTSLTNKLPPHLRSNSQQKKYITHNASIDTKVKANSKIEFYKPRIDISKKHANEEYEMVNDGSQYLGRAIKGPAELEELPKDEFALSIHENEEISLKSLHSRHWKKAPF